MTKFTKDPSTHPASGPLTKERLMRVRDELTAAAKRSDGGNLGYMMADAAKAIDELLDRRKAPQLPQPAVVPDAIEIDDDFDSSFEHGKAVGWNAFRAAMLQGAEPVEKECKLPDGFDFDRFNDVVWLDAVANNPHMHSPTTSVIAMVALELNRKLDKPELTVWYGSMPETNGKSNWTAILHRKGECLSKGITVDCSEYPDRVRYEADRVRYLIGELADEPDILAYDADAHSGYAEPVSQPYTLPADVIDALEKALQAMSFMGDTLNALDAVCEEDVEYVTPAFEAVREVLEFAEPTQGWIPCSERMPLPAAPQQEVKSALEMGMARYGDAMQKLADGGD